MSAAEHEKVNLSDRFAKYQPSRVDPVVEATVKEIRSIMCVKQSGTVGHRVGSRQMIRTLASGRCFNVGLVASKFLWRVL